MPGNYEDRRGPPVDGLVTAETVTVAATAAAVLIGRPSKAGGYYTFENAGATDIHIVFGTSATMGAPTATANAGIIRAGTRVDWYVAGNVSHWRALAITSDSTLRYWRR